MEKYIDLSNGEIVFLYSTVSTGFHYDVNGREYNFIQVGANFIDPMTGTVLKYDAVAPDTWDTYAPYLLFISNDNASRHAITAYGNAALDGNGAIAFDGSGDYLTINNPIDVYTATGQFTYDFEFKSTDLTLASQYVLGWRSGDNTNNISFCIYIYLSTIVIDVWNNSDSRMVSGQTVATCTQNVWHHGRVVRNGANFYVSIDGNVTTLVGNTNTIDPDYANFQIGQAVGGFSGTKAPFKGYMRNIHLSTGVARSGADNFTPPTSIVTDEYTKLAIVGTGATSSTRIIDSAVPANDSTPGKILDTSPNLFDGTVNGNPIWSGATDTLIFDGTGDYLSKASATLTGTRTHYWKGNFTKPVTTDDFYFGDSTFNIGMDPNGYVFANGGTKKTFEAVDRSGAEHTFALEYNTALFPASDDFGGSGYNSASFGDINWSNRWITAVNDGTVSISASKAVLSSTASGSLKQQDVYVPLNIAGDFSVQVDYEVVSLPNPSGIQFYIWLSPTTHIYVQRVYSPHVVGYTGGSLSVGSGEKLTGTFKMVRTSGVTSIYIDATLLTTVSNSANLIRCGINVNGTNGTVSGKFDNLIIQDGSSNPIYVPVAQMYVDGTNVGIKYIGTGTNAAFGIGARNDGNSPIIGTVKVPMIIKASAYQSGLNTLVADYTHTP